tara:strand:- start:1226 stop:1591 length:366 start_codon:yes stop_codon:yes gene_type:complete
MSFRYNNRPFFKNIGLRRDTFLEPDQRNRSNAAAMDNVDIVQYVTPIIEHPTEEDFLHINSQSYVWQYGDKFWKVATKFYGMPTVWWIIPWFNKKPLEADYKPGDVIEIPFPLSDLYQYFQ